jgi:cell wall-associated NlpC family hydrolase
MRYVWVIAVVGTLISCHKKEVKNVDVPVVPQKASVVIQDTTVLTADTIVPDDPNAYQVKTGIVTPEELVIYAQTLRGVPYQYACSDPEKGFDCSGFINYVFNRFYIKVPRSSVDFTNVGKEVPLEDAKPGDLILFTGTNNTIRTVGHIGIVTSHIADSLVFIHSSSGSANGVTMTPLNEYYQGRFMKIVRVFAQNDKK